jgi:hypothetical protein
MPDIGNIGDNSAENPTSMISPALVGWKKSMKKVFKM